MAYEGLAEETAAAQTPVLPTAKLFAAMAKAKAEFPDIPRNRQAVVKMKAGGQYSYSYADLADVFAAINPVLSAYGLSVWQFPSERSLRTVIAHESGETFEGEPWPIKPMPLRNLDDAQSFQSAVQASKRYALTALLGITTEETVEGHTRFGRDQSVTLDDKFETGDGVRLPRGAKIEKGWAPRKVAEEVARAIGAQFDDVKTIKGVEGVWDRNSMFVEKLRDKHPDLFSNLFDLYSAYIDEKGAEQSE